MPTITERIEHRLPVGMRPAWRLAVRTAGEIVDDRVTGLAAEAAFFALLSFVPLLLALLGAVGWVLDLLGAEATAEINRLVYGVPRTFLSARTFDAYRQIAEEILAGGRGSVVSVGFVVALWGGSRAVNAFLEAINIAYDLERPRSLWRRRLLALGITVAGAVLGALVVPALVLGPRLLRWLVPGPLVVVVPGWVATAGFYLALAVVTVALIATFYHVAVPWHTPWLRDLPGAVVGMVLWLLGAGALRTYIAFSFRGDNLYSSFAAPLAVMLWLFVTAFAVLLGAELNAEIEKMWPHAGTPDEFRDDRSDPADASGEPRSIPQRLRR
ncbi:MAG: YihY/virulence factor BrkB family protein [Actinomycetota bacterium]|nr:YihY/virulence factor BrkB family protein [Actinomycetota bacterium]